MIGPCLDSIAAGAGGLSVEVLVVDNASRDRTGELVAARPAVRLLRQRDNLGFAAGCNAGLRAARGRELLLLNPDTTLTPGVLARLVATLTRCPEVGLVGASLVSPSERTARPAIHQWPTLGRMFTHHTPLKHVARWLPRRRWRPLADRPTIDGYLMGACFLIRRTLFEQAGPLDDRYFFYFEDVDYSRRAVLSGWKLLWLSDAAIYHRGGEGTAHFDTAWRHWQFLSGARRYFGSTRWAPGFAVTWTLFKLLHLADLALIALESGSKRWVYAALGRRANADKHGRRWRLASSFLGRFAWRFGRW